LGLGALAGASPLALRFLNATRLRPRFWPLVQPFPQGPVDLLRLGHADRLLVAAHRLAQLGIELREIADLLSWRHSLSIYRCMSGHLAAKLLPDYRTNDGFLNLARHYIWRPAES